MSIRVSDPLFLLSAQTGLSAFELQAKAASGNPDVEKPQEALKTGEPIPIIFCRRTTANKGGVLVQPKMTEGFFSNTFSETLTYDGSTTINNINQKLSVKYLLVLGEGNIAQMQVRDLFYGNDRRGTFNQKYNGRAGTWNPGNEMDEFTLVLTPDANGIYDISTLSTDLGLGQTARAGSVVFYKTSSGALLEGTYQEQSFPAFSGTSGTYSGLTTLSFEYTHTDGKAAKAGKTVSAFVRDGLQVTRLVDSVFGASDNYADLVKYLFEANNRLASDLIDTAALTVAANFVEANGFYFNGAITESQNLLDWLQKTSVNFLLRVSNSGGKFGLLPRLPYNTDYTIKTTQITPEFTFTEDHVIQGGFEIEYISLEDREPVCFVLQWRQQPDADFGLVRTVEVRYTGEATNGPFINIDMSGYCTSEDHAVKVGLYRLAQRKYVTHHLRLTVREQNYNATLVIGDLVRVRLRRETSEGEVEYHDKVYEINRIEKRFDSTIKYDLTHFPIDAQGRSLVTADVDVASGAGNIIDVGRSTFDGDENSSTDTTLIGTASGGGGTIPSAEDTSFDTSFNTSEVGGGSSFPGGPSSFEDPIDQDLPTGYPRIQGYTGQPTVGDILTFSPGCEGAYTDWYQVDIESFPAVSINSDLKIGGNLSELEVTEAMLDPTKGVIGVGRCPDPSSPDGYGPPVYSDVVVPADIVWEWYGEVYIEQNTTLCSVFASGPFMYSETQGQWRVATINSVDFTYGDNTCANGIDRGVQISYTITRDKDGNTVNTTTGWPLAIGVNTDSYGMRPAGYRIWKKPRPTSQNQYPDAPTTLVASGINPDLTNYVLPSTNYPT